MMSAQQQKIPELKIPELNVENTPETSAPIPTPDVLADRYRFIRIIGQGAQGNVYLAERIADGLQVAIKELSLNSVESFKDYDMFLRESEALASLSVYGVAKFYEGPRTEDGVLTSQYLVQEYIPGYTLSEYYKLGKMTQKDIYHFALQMIGILMALHLHTPPIIHRDLKPGNIIMRDMGNGRIAPYVVDFGAVANPQKLENGTTVTGTFGYMPPEQYMGQSSAACDTYALAVILVYLLSGVSPEALEVGNDLRLKIEPVLKEVPKAVIHTLRDMLNPKPNMRLSDLELIKERFADFYAGIFRISLWNRFKAGEFKHEVSPMVVVVAILSTFVFLGIMYFLLAPPKYEPASPTEQAVIPGQPVQPLEPGAFTERILQNREAVDCIVGKWYCPITVARGDVTKIEYHFYFNKGYEDPEKRRRVRAQNGFAPVIMGTRTRTLRNGKVETRKYDSVYAGSYDNSLVFDRTIDEIRSESSSMNYSCNERALQFWGDDKNNFVTCSRMMK